MSKLNRGRYTPPSRGVRVRNSALALGAAVISSGFSLSVEAGASPAKPPVTSTQSFYACINTSENEIIGVEAVPFTPQFCASNGQTTVLTQITGQQGIQGSQGAPGTGAQGTQGNQGNQGNNGSQGFQGTQGAQGPQGVQGAQGIQGPRGVQGNQGFQGAQGALGAQGNQGPRGVQGNQGFQGAQGAQGGNGAQGPQGVQGNQGQAANGTFAEFYGLQPSDYPATVAVGADVPFPRSGPAAGSIITIVNPGVFQLSNIGTYEISFVVPVDEPGQLEVSINGILQSYTVVGRATGTSAIVGQSLVTTTLADSEIAIENASSSSALTITPNAGGTSPVSASLIIQQLQ
jgi:collagen triple helix repeat protein